MSSSFTSESMPTDSLSMSTWMREQGIEIGDLFIETFCDGLFPRLRSILPERLQILINEFSQLIRQSPPPPSDVMNTRLYELNLDANHLSDIYYAEYNAGTLPYYIFHIIDRVAQEIRIIIYRVNYDENDYQDASELRRHEPEPMQIQFPQTRFGMGNFMRLMERDRNNLFRYSDLVPDDVYNNLPQLLREYLDELTNLIGLRFSIPDNYNAALREIQENEQLKTQINDIYNHAKGFLYSNQRYSDAYLADYILTKIGRLIGRQDLYLIA